MIIFQNERVYPKNMEILSPTHMNNDTIRLNIISPIRDKVNQIVKRKKRENENTSNRP